MSDVLLTDGERRVLGSAVAELSAAYPDVPVETIAALMDRAAASYADATVRTFLPILVPKDVRNTLRGMAAAQPALSDHVVQLPASLVARPGLGAGMVTAT